MKKHKGQDDKIHPGSIAEAYAHGRGLVGYLRVSPNAAHDFREAQAKCQLPQVTINQDVKTRWRTAHDMGQQLCTNKAAIMELDKNPSYKTPGETWGKNKLTMTMWDYLDEGTAVLAEAAKASQILEGDLYPTSSLVVPMVYAIMASSSPLVSVKFRNRADDEFNDASLNPVRVSHDELTPKVQVARKAYHERLIKYFDSEVAMTVKKFWFISSMLDVRFKKLAFKNDRMLTQLMRRNAVKWLTEEFNRHYKGKFNSKTTASGEAVARQLHVKRRKTSTADFFAGSSDSDSDGEQEAPAKDELQAYLELPQVKCATEQEALNWWRDHTDEFPNLAVMARQYLGCPASSAAVERLFSQVGIAFSSKRKSAHADTLESILFARCNLP